MVKRPWLSTGGASNYLELVSRAGPRYEVEHIWANHPEQHEDEFEHPHDFAEERNRIGGLLLLPKRFNASFGDRPYEDKVEHYYGQNLLAGSLHSRAYELNPGFVSFVKRSGLPFRPHECFRKEDLRSRGELYRQIARQIWDPNDLLSEVG